jgi:hypothetical protein
MVDIAIQAENLGKQYRIGTLQELPPLLRG